MRKLIESITPTTFVGIKPGSTIHGCEPCMAFWADSDSCFLCEEGGIVVAKPLSSGLLKISLPAGSIQINGTHYVENQEIAEIIKRINKHV